MEHPQERLRVLDHEADQTAGSREHAEKLQKAAPLTSHDGAQARAPQKIDDDAPPHVDHRRLPPAPRGLRS